jgi:hypothetical protein
MAMEMKLEVCAVQLTAVGLACSGISGISGTAQVAEGLTT